MKAAAAFAGLYVIRRIVGVVEEFNQAMKSSMAIMGQLSVAMQNQLARAAKEVAAAFKYTSKETAAAFYYLTSAGMNVVQSLAALPQVAAFGQAGMFNLSRATDLLTDAQSALGLSSKDAQENLENLTRVSDVLVGANTLANASVEQFAEALAGKFGAALRAVGKDVEEGGALLAAFADSGIKGNEAAMQGNIVLRDLQSKALLNKKAFRELNVTVFDSAGYMLHFADIIRSLETAFDGLSPAEKKAALMTLGFTDKSVNALLVLVGLSEKVADYDKSLRGMSGITKEVSDKQLPTFTKAMQKLWNVAERVLGALLAVPLEEFGNLLLAILPALVKVVEGMERVAETAKKAAAEIRGAFVGALDDLKAAVDRTFGAETEAAIDNVAVGQQKLFEILTRLKTLEPGGYLPGMADTLGEGKIAKVSAAMQLLNQAAQEGELTQKQYAVALGILKDKLDALKTAAQRLAQMERTAAAPAEAMLEKMRREVGKLAGGSVGAMQSAMNEFRSALEAADLTGTWGGRKLELQAEALMEQWRQLGEVQRQNDIYKTMEERAKQLYLNSRTPLEKLRTEIMELVKLWQTGFIQGPTFGRAAAQLLQAFDRAVPRIEAPAGPLRGTQEAYQTVQRLRSEQKRDTRLDRVIQELVEQTRLGDDQANTLDAIRDILDGIEVESL